MAVVLPSFRPCRAGGAAGRAAAALARRAPGRGRARSTPAQLAGGAGRSRASRTSGSGGSSSPTALISGDALGAALARQSGLGRIDLAASPADPELVRGIDPYRCLALEAVPWRQIGGTRVVAIANPDNAEAAMAACGGAAARVALALAAPEDIRRAITEAFAGRLRDDARERCPEAFSCRGWAQRRHRAAGWRRCGRAARRGGGGAGAGAADRHGLGARSPTR